MADTFAARFTAGLKKQDGYVTRTDGTDLGDTDTYTLTAKFVWTPTDKLTGKFLARLHAFGRERQAAGVRGHQHGRHLPARRQRGCRLPGLQRQFRDAAGGAEDSGRLAAPTISRRADRSATTAPRR